MKKIIFLFTVFFLLLINISFSKILISGESPGIIAISYYQNSSIKIVIANPSRDEKKLKISYGYYELKPVKIQTKQVQINPEEILLFSFKNPKIKSGARLYDMVFISKDEEGEELISALYVQKLNPAVNYFKCSKFFINEYNICKVLLNLNPKKRDNCFYILSNKTQTIPDNACETTLYAKALIGLSRVNPEDLKNFKIENDYMEKIKKDSENGKIFSGYGYLYLKLGVLNLKTPVIISPVIKEYRFGNNETSLGDLTPPQILFYPTDYTIREQ